MIWNYEIKKGDRVMALLSGGGYAEYCLVDERHIMPIPEGLSFEQVAACPFFSCCKFLLKRDVGGNSTNFSFSTLSLIEFYCNHTLILLEPYYLMNRQLPFPKFG